jgi:lambda family phage portal protein
MTILQRIAALFGYRKFNRVPANGHSNIRMYAAAKSSRLTGNWGSIITSADAEISASIRSLRSRSRELFRDAAYAKRAKVIVVNNVVGSGIGLQAQVKTTRDELNKRVNDDIEAAWAEWSRAENCHTGGSLHFADIERIAMGEIFEAGEVFIRKHYRSFGSSTVPYALEVIEPERVVDEQQPSPLDPRLRVRFGVEMDDLYRPVAYWIRTVHPGEISLSTHDIDRIERVPAEQIIHLRIIDRWPQTRGIPWLHAVARRLNDMDGLSEAEITAARGAANYMATIETDGEYGSDPSVTGSGTAGTAGSPGREVVLEPGIVERLSPGEKLNFVAPNRPNTALDPFMRMMLREVAAGTGPSYESLSRDYSQSNYSSSRLALLDDRDLWRTFQTWFIRSFRDPVHRDFIQAAILSRSISSVSIEQFALDMQKFTAVRFKPRGWSWVDPTKEVEAYKEAVKAGFITRTDVIAQTANGRDREDIDEERAQELQSQEEKDLSYDTDPDMYEPKETPEPVKPKENDGGNENGQDAEDRKTVPLISRRAGGNKQR